MKKQLAIYLTMCAVVFLCASCLSSDDDEKIETYPYASLLSFSVGNMKLPVNTVTEAGKDTVIVKTVLGSLYRFVIDSKGGVVYNPDSLPKGCDVSKVTTIINSDGIAYFYSEENDTYEPVTSSDSIDFSSPRKLIITSTDGTYVKEYMVSLNVHKTDPDVMYWESLASVSVTTPIRSVAFGGRMFVYGYNNAEETVVTSTLLDGAPAWDTPVVLGDNYGSASLKAMLQFNNKLYLTKETGELAESYDGVNWTNRVFADMSIKSLLAASDVDGKIWVVANVAGAQSDSIMYSTDGVSFEATEELPENFSLYNISSMVYPLSTNPYIQRYVLVGYPTQDSDVKPVVWSKLSTEDRWMQLEPAGDGKFNCPALENLTVLRYDDKLYALGGAGTVNNENIEPFAAYYISRDNGLTWLKSVDEKVVLPETLVGNRASFAATVDDRQRMWIVTGGDNPSVWRGVINRLAY